MRKEFVEKQKKILQEKRAEILETLAGRNEQLAKLIETSETGDVVDIASDRIDGNLISQLGDEDARRLTMIDNALENISRGSYGICASCGQEIAEIRLESIPYVALCLNCQAAEDRRNR